MDNNKIYFAKMKEEAIIPSKRSEDGAFDIYACFEEDYRVIRPQETVIIPTGLASAFSPMYVAILKERGSTGTKGMGQRAGVIDSGYRGEWLIPITNLNAKPIIIAKEGYVLEDIYQNQDVIIYPYEKAICQCMMVEVPQLTTEEMSYEELLKFESERGTGRLGSSGK